MRTILSVLVLAVCTVAWAADGAVVWEAELEAGVARAAREGRPLLFAINALEGEGANEALRRQAYRSRRWGEATRDYVCFVCNAGSHGSASGDASCERYGGIPCRSHKDAWRYVARRFAPNDGALISPQHIILEPDGGLAFRKEYYTGTVKPELLELYGVRISPLLAYESAGDLRASRIESLESASTPDVKETARSWLRSGDVYAAASILRVVDFEYDDERRLALLEALEATPTGQLPVLALFSDEVGARPDDRPKETVAFARTLLALERQAGVRLITRIACHTGDEKLRRQVLDLWRGADRAPPRDEQPLWVETHLLCGLPAAPGLDREAPDAVGHRRLSRAELHAGLRERLHPPLLEALESGTPESVRGALLEARPDEVRQHADRVVSVLTSAPPVPRLRFAAAIALLGARVDAEGLVAPAVAEAVTDPLEGPELHAEALSRLGEDPGGGADVWEAAARDALKRSR